VPIGIEQREPLEKRAVVRLLHVLLEGERALGFGELEDGIQQTQELEIGALIVFLSLEQAQHRPAGGLQDWAAIGDHEGAECRAADDQEFEGLEQHDHVTAVQRVAAEHAHQDNGRSDQQEHGFGRGAVARSAHPVRIALRTPLGDARAPLGQRDARPRIRRPENGISNR